MKFYNHSVDTCTILRINFSRTAAQKEKESLKASSSTKVPFLEGPNQQATNQQHGQRQQQMLFQDLQEDEQEVEQLRLREVNMKELIYTIRADCIMDLNH